LQSRILIADDNDVVRRALRGLIRHDESLAVVGEASNGQSALEAIKTLQPDLVCLDVLMPGLDGLSILRTIREEHPAIRVVLVTGQATSDVVSQARELGANGFVVKPFNAAKVLAAIRTALGRGGVASTPPGTAA
jgi:two-component system, chemotaxis family, chemotaxis protein CheY